MKISDIYESFNSVYRVERLGDTVKFMTEEGLQYTISFERLDGRFRLEYLAHKHGLPSDFLHPQSKTIHIEFFLNQGNTQVSKFDDKMPNKVTNNPIRVYATVMDELFRYVHTNQIDVIDFSGREKLGALYKRLVKSFVPKDWAVKTKSASRSEFLIYKKSHGND